MNYKKIYANLCDKAKSQKEKRVLYKKNKVYYYECHHIIPKCEGGLGNYGNYNHENIVLLTPKEHYIAHLLLCEIYQNSKKLKYALFAMINQKSTRINRYTPSSTTYERLRKQFIDVLKSTPKTEDHIKKVTKAINTPEVKKKKSEKLKGVAKTEDHKKKLKDRWQDPIKRKMILDSMKKAYSDPNVRENRKRSSMMGNLKIKNSPDVKCPYCDKIGKKARLSRWHFENCKHKKKRTEI